MSENGYSIKIKIIIYDGICGFCNRWVQFILNNKPDNNIKFIAYQSESAEPIIKKYNIISLESIVLIEGNKFYDRSNAMLRIMRLLGSSWKYVYYFIYTPHPIRDVVYKIFAKNRYKLMGKVDSCKIPTSRERELFVE